MSARKPARRRNPAASTPPEPTDPDDVEIDPEDVEIVDEDEIEIEDVEIVDEDEIEIEDVEDDEHDDVEEDEVPQAIPDAEVPAGAALVTSNLGKDYGDGMGLGALDLEVHPGELVMLVGPNGAGKSTLLGLAAGLVEPTNGAAWVLGQKIGTLHARAATSYLPDAPVLYDDLSLWEHVEYIARMHATKDWEEYADDLLDMFNLTDRVDDLPSRFSRGLKQKTSLILGLIRPFSLLLIDEPFVGLDTPGQETLVEVLADVAEQGAAVVVSTHQMDLTPRATRCVGLRDGEKSYDGPATPEKIRSLVGG